jgi:hypothetical protein
LERPKGLSFGKRMMSESVNEEDLRFWFLSSRTRTKKAEAKVERI